MISLEDFLEEWICTDREAKTFMTRKEYYEKHIPNGDPKELYDQLKRCKTWNSILV